MRGDYPWRVMVSSTMRDLGPERQATVAEIERAGLKPLWAEGNPVELEKRPRGFCQEMAETCDLFLLIVGPTYGFTPEGKPADNGRSVTELELDWATAANLRKVVIFIRADAEKTPDVQQRALVERIRNFERGYVTFPPFSTTDELARQVHQALTNWLEAHEGGRSAWLKKVVQRYATLRNLVTQRDMPIGETALLQLRTEVVDQQERRTWNSAAALEGGSARERRVATAAERVVKFLSGKVDDARQQEDERTASTPIIRSVQEFIDAFQRLVIVGDPGAGKSTLLRRQAHDVAAQALRQSVRVVPRPLIPIYLAAPTLAGALAARARSPRDLTADALADAGPLATLAETVAALAISGMADAVALDARLVLVEAITQGEALLLVDGLDEVDASQRGPLLTALEALGRNCALLALRPSALQRGTPQDWRICDVQTLDEQRRKALIVRTLESLDARSPEASVAGLAAKLKPRPDLAAWSGNPLLLTLLATQYGRMGSLPKQRAQIYAYAINALLDSRGRAAKSALTPEQLRACLERLALRMMRERVVTVTVERLCAWASDEPEKPLTDEIAADLLGRADLLQQQSPGGWGFVHLTFQEYLAASALAGMLSDERHEEAHQELLRRRFSAWWEQVYFLLISELDSPPHPKAEIANAIIRWLIVVDGQRTKALDGRDPTHAALRLATRLYFSRSAASQDPALRRSLAMCWRPLWRDALRQSATSSTLHTLTDIIDDLAMPPYLMIGAALAPSPAEWIWRIPRRRLASAVEVTAALLLFVGDISQIPALQRVGSLEPLVILALLLALSIERVLLRRWQQGQSAIAVYERALGDPQFDSIATTKQPDVVRGVLAHLENTDSNERRKAVQALGRMGPALTEQPDMVLGLLARLDDHDVNVRWMVAQTLGRLGPALAEQPNVVRRLLAHLESPDSNVRRMVARALGALGPALAEQPGVARRLLAHLDDPDVNVRRMVARALGRLGPALAEQPGVARRQLTPLESSDEGVRRMKAQAPGILEPAQRWGVIRFERAIAADRRGTLLRRLLAGIGWLCDWPVLAGVVVAQVVVIWPALVHIAPFSPLVHIILSMTAGGQILLIITGYLIVNGIISGFVLTMAEGQSKARNTALESLENAIAQVDDASQAEKPPDAR